MLNYVHAILKAAENNQSISTRDAVFSCMREMGLDDFGEVLMLMPQPEFPKLSKLLPTMASADVQNHWTGDNGYRLLRQTCNFVRSMTYNYARISGRQLTDAVVLDYGCGYGRIALLMYYFSTTERVIGVDPWDRSIAECQAAWLGPNQSPNAKPRGLARIFDSRTIFRRSCPSMTCPSTSLTPSRSLRTLPRGRLFALCGRRAPEKIRSFARKPSLKYAA